jgi:Flp pilus assembly protein TadD
MLDRAEKLEDEGRLGEAEQILKAAEARDPQSARVQADLGMLALRREDWGGAVTALRRASVRAPRNAGILFYLAQAYDQSGDGADAVEALDRAARLAPGDPQIAQKHGEYLCNTDPDCGRGLRELLRAQQLDPTLPEIDFDLGIAEYKNRQPAEAERSFAAELKRSPANARAEFYLGELAVLRLDWAAGRDHYLASIQKDGSHGDAFYGAGHCLMMLGRPGEAVPLLQRALELDPRLLKSHFLLARAYRQLGDPQQADQELALFREAQAREDATSPLVPVQTLQDEKTWQRMKALVEAGDDAGLAAYLHGLADARHVANFNVGVEVGVIYDIFGQPARAERVLRRAIAERPQDADAHAWLGHALLLERRPADAEPELKEAFRLSPGSQAALVGLGELSYMRGRWAEAAGYLEDSRSRQPDVLVMLCDAYAKAGQRSQAQTTAELLRIFAPADQDALRQADRILRADAAPAP